MKHEYYSCTYERKGRNCPLPPNPLKKKRKKRKNTNYFSVSLSPLVLHILCGSDSHTPRLQFPHRAFFYQFSQLQGSCFLQCITGQAWRWEKNWFSTDGVLFRVQKELCNLSFVQRQIQKIDCSLLFSIWQEVIAFCKSKNLTWNPAIPWDWSDMSVYSVDAFISLVILSFLSRQWSKTVTSRAQCSDLL